MIPEIAIVEILTGTGLLSITIIQILQLRQIQKIEKAIRELKRVSSK